MKKDWVLIISIITLLVIIGTYLITLFIIDLPSKNDSKNLQNQVSNLSEKIDNLTQAIEISSNQNINLSTQLVKIASLSIPKPQNLSSTFHYAGQSSLDLINSSCQAPNCQQISGAPFVSNFIFNNSTLFSIAELEINNPENTSQKNPYVKIDCGGNVNLVFPEVLISPSSQPVILNSYSSFKGFNWYLEFKEIVPGEISLFLPYAFISNPNWMECSLQYGSDSSSPPPENFIISNESITKLS